MGHFNGKLGNTHAQCQVTGW